MRSCTVTKRMRIVAGGLDDYKKLARYHYRDSNLAVYAAIFALKLAEESVGVIVYTMPSPGLELRNIATDNLFSGFDRATRLALISKNIRRISRVIIEPRFRNLGLASRLVRETLGAVNVPIVEAMAVMGLVNPFFEKAGMTAYKARTPARCVRLTEAFGMVGAEEDTFIDPQKVQRKIGLLRAQQAEFIEFEIGHFLQSYGKRRVMPPGLERTGFVLSKLTLRPVYYIWLNENLELRIKGTEGKSKSKNIETKGQGR